MKKGFKIFGAMAIAMIIGFSIAACGNHALDGLNNYTVTITNGSGSGSYAAGSTVTITATVAQGQQFQGWTVTSGGVVLADPNSQTTTFIMPSNAVSITANLTLVGGTSSNSSGGGTSSNSGGSTPGTYSVTVNGGTGSGYYTPGAIVTITATPPSGKTFVNWTVNGASLNSTTNPSTNFTMPSKDVTITANYVDGGSSNTIITITNNTGSAIKDVRIKPSTSNKWGEDKETGTLANGAPKQYTITAPYSSTNEYDIILSTDNFTMTNNNTGLYVGSRNVYRQYKVKITSGMTIEFTASNLDNGSTLPTITIRNRTGIKGSTIRLKPTGTFDDWTEHEINFDNNNSGTKIDINIPLANYSTYDFELVSGNPVNSFTQNNVTISNGTVVTFTSATATSAITGDPNIVIENNTGASIYHLYIRLAGATEWGSDLHSGVLANDQSYATLVNRSFLNQRVDVKVGNSSAANPSINYVKSNVLLTEGIILNFTTLDKQ